MGLRAEHQVVRALRAVISPVPANPTSANNWSGAIAAWGFGLFSSGRYAITQLPSARP